MKTYTPTDAPTAVLFDSGLIAVARLLLACSVLFIIVPLNLDDLSIFHVIAALYTLYSATLYALSRFHVPAALSPHLYWVDLVWAALLTEFSDDSSTAFLFLFPTLVAALQWRFALALRFTLIAVVLMITVNAQLPLDENLSIPEVVLPPIYLLVFGYLVALWGDREGAAKRRLLLLKEATKLANPRFGADRMICTMMERLRAHYDAEVCLLIVSDSASSSYLLRQADRRNAERALVARSIPAETAYLLLALPAEQALIYPGTRRSWAWMRPPAPICYAVDIQQSDCVSAAPPLNDSLIALLDAEAFISIPVRYPDITIGRLYLTAARRGAFVPADMLFLLQVIEQIVPVIENIRLVDRLASSAAEAERRRLAHDIHDNVIQPYIGFQIALAAISRKLQTGRGDVAGDMAKLMATTEHEIASLRSYIHGLPERGEHESSLLAAIRRFVTTFAEATHIAVEIDVPTDLYANDRLAAEVFQMVVEGLNNIRRHTHAAHAVLRLAREDDQLMVQIANDDVEGIVPDDFIPRSISQRAAALGGQTRVERAVGGGAQVIIDIPL